MTDLQSLVEYGPAVEVRLTHEVALTLGTSGVVDVTPALRRGHWNVAPKGKVGAVRVGDQVVRVAPKVPIGRVMFLLDHALRDRGRVDWHSGHVDVAVETDLLQAMAVVFAAAAEDAVRPGLLQGYRTVEEALPVVRGRIRTGEQLRRRHGLAVPVEVRYDDFTVDTDENRLLRAATERLLRLRGLRRDVRTRLHRLQRRFADVGVLVRGVERPRWRASRLNARYVPALRLADMILAGSSFEHRPGTLPVSGFVLDMPRVFEDFVTVALGSALRAHGGRVEAQHRTWLDVDAEVSIKPDVVWLSGTGRPLAVVDAKYKAEKPAGFPDADLYQALAYAVALGLPVAHLVYAKGNEAHRSHVVRHAGIRLVAHALDLSLPPRALLGQVSELAGRIAVDAGLADTGSVA